MQNTCRICNVEAPVSIRVPANERRTRQDLRHTPAYLACGPGPIRTLDPKPYLKTSLAVADQGSQGTSSVIVLPISIQIPQED